MLARRLSLALSSPLLLAGLASAHEREFTLSRDWFLPYRGESEFELRSYFDTSHGRYRNQLEYEYGVTDWFALEPGFQVEERDDGHREVTAADLELRFHAREFDYDRWLPALNLELEHPVGDGDEDGKVELKAVASRYGSNGLDLTLNLNVGRRTAGDRGTESELTGGFVLPLVPDEQPSPGWHHGLCAGAEMVADFEEHDVRVGPLVSWRASEHVNVLGSWTFGVNDRDGTNFDQLALIVEYEL